MVLITLKNITLNSQDFGHNSRGIQSRVIKRELPNTSRINGKENVINLEMGIEKKDTQK